jgi:D-serine deaminase-like pyridoxal phosphate-dependent protein
MTTRGSIVAVCLSAEGGVPTPALLVDLPAMERNICRMAEFFADGPPVCVRATR